MDILGDALTDFYKKGTSDTLWLHNSYGEPEEMPVDIFFRSEDEMPELELIALDMCRGKILDAGAGAGSHALALQKMKKDVTALDISERAVAIMKQRGVEKAIAADIFSFQHTSFDTILFLMNGIGLTGTIDGLIHFLETVKPLLAKGGQLLFDSSDISYMYHDGIKRPVNKYYGEVSYQYEYNGKKDKWFNWLYADQETLKRIAENAGYEYELMFDDNEDQHLIKLTLQYKQQAG